MTLPRQPMCVGSCDLLGRLPSPSGHDARGFDATCLARGEGVVSGGRLMGVGQPAGVRGAGLD